MSGSKPGRPRNHGGYAFLIRGVLPERRRYLRPYLSEIREGLIHDLAAREEDLSTAQRALIDRAVTFLGVIRLMEEHAREKGVFRNSQGMLSPSLGTHYLAFNRNFREILGMLGIERRQTEHEPTLAEIIKEFDENKKTEQEAQAGREAAGEGNDSGEGEKIHSTHSSRDAEPRKLMVD